MKTQITIKQNKTENPDATFIIFDDNWNELVEVDDVGFLAPVNYASVLIEAGFELTNVVSNHLNCRVEEWELNGLFSPLTNGFFFENEPNNQNTKHLDARIDWEAINQNRD